MKNKNRLSSIFFILALSLALPVFAGSASTHIDHNEGELGDQFNLTITLSGDLSGEIELPPIKDLIVSGTGTSTNVSWINGSFSKETSYNFSLDPQKDGVFTIPAIKLKVDGQDLLTEAVSFQVRKPGSSATNQNSTPQNSTQTARQGQEQAQVQENSSDLFIEREFSKKSPYEGEPIVVTTKIFHRVELVNVEAANEKPAGLRILDIKQSNTQEERSGSLYNVIVVKQTFVPLRAGKLNIPGFRIQASMVASEPSRRRNSRGRSFDDLFENFMGRSQGRVVRRVIASPETQLDVKVIPNQGRPQNFQDLVGTFRISSEFSSSKIKAGETANLSITIDGVGALDSLTALNLQLSPNIKIYADKSKTEERATERWGLESKRIFRFALVPTEAGELKLGEFKLPYFDYSTGSFQELRTDLGTIHVAESDEKNATVSTPSSHTRSKTDVQAIAHDLIDLHRDTALNSSQILSKKDYIFASFLLGIPTLLCLILLLMQALNNWRGSNIVGRRRSQALKLFETKKTQVRKEQNQNPSALLENYALAYREYLGNKFNLQGNALTSKEIRPKLSQLKVPDNILKIAEDIANQVEFSQYSNTQLQSTQVQGLMMQIDSIVQEIEQKC